MNFRESELFLLSLGNEVSAMKLGLENIRKLLAALGDPQNNYFKAQVAGTNGKGSVCAFISAICFSAGIKTGVYTSPHLISLTERIQINGLDIHEDDFARHATTVREVAEKLLAHGECQHLPTFFEQVTAIALLAFAEAKVELAVLETGLGGRLDATTAANAEIAAITQIDYDHQEYLGQSLAEIAAEKAAMIHKGSQVIVAEQQPAAGQVVGERCERFGIDALLTSQIRTTRGSGWLNLGTAKAAYRVSELGLRGRHQVENAKVAILLAETLQTDFDISTENIADGLESARHPGRLEFNGQYLFDGAHNVAGARALRQFLDEFIDGWVTLIFGAMSGKDVAGMAEMLFQKADKIILTRPENSRAVNPEEIISLVSASFDRTHIFLTTSVDEALTKAKEVTGGNGLILVTGSLYLVGEAKKILNN